MKPFVPHRLVALVVFLSAGFLTDFATAEAAEEIPPKVWDFLDVYCMECHDPDVAKGDFDVDFLKISQAAEDAEYWQLVLDNLHLGEMPPEDEKKQPTMEELKPVIAWIEAELQRAAKALAGHTGEVVLKRLNRTEYEYTIEDLFGVKGEFASGFPADATEEGFDNIGAALTLSAEQLDQYLEAASYVLDRAIVTEDRPQAKKATFTLHQYNQRAWENFRKRLEREREQFDSLTPNEKKQAREREALFKANPNTGFEFPVWQDGKLREPTPDDGPESDAVIAIMASYAAPTTRDLFRVREEGWYRFAITAYAAANQGEPVRLKLTYGSFRQGTIPEVADVIQLTDEAPKTFEYRLYLQPNQQVKIQMIDGTNWARREDLVDLPGPFVAIRSMEMEGPLIEQWPPQGHQLVLGTRDATSLTDEEAKTALAECATKLFRRPVPDAIVEDYRAFYDAMRADQVGELDAFKLTVQTMMASPLFLYHVEPGDVPDGYALANRLSYFLWRSAPDAELLDLAEGNQLSQPSVLRAQVERLLDDPRSERFLKDFVGQWLKVNLVGEMEPDNNLYPEYDAELERAMVAETEGFIREMLKEDSPLGDLIASDWTVLNDRLAEHYGIDGVQGNRFRRVKLDPSETVRGGLLTQASILNVTSNGTVTSPVVRGIWVLERLLGIEPSPPPPDVPAIEPDIRGATTIQEQLAKHREIAQCGACHAKIDPYGMALENFDVIGGWREKYRALEPTANANRPKLVEGQPVVAADRIPRQGSFEDFREFREMLREREDLVEENVVHTLAVYALGRTMDFADEANLRAITERVRLNDGGLRSAVHELVASELFRRP